VAVGGDGAVVAVAVVVILGVVTVAVRSLLRIPAEVRRAHLDVARATSGLRRARAGHARTVRAEQSALRRAERAHSAAVAALDRRVAALEDPRGRRIASIGPVTLHELRILTPAGEVDLDGVEATVDTAGGLSESKRTTLTRLAVGGLVLGPLGAILALGFPKRRTVDTRELFLLVEAGPASCVVQVRPDDGATVRAFAVQVNAAAAAVAARRIAIADELAGARKALGETREDLSTLDAARSRLAAARTDATALAAVAAAEVTLAAARERLAAAIADRG
jgi:hypothetical protein